MPNFSDLVDLIVDGEDPDQLLSDLIEAKKSKNPPDHDDNDEPHDALKYSRKLGKAGAVLGGAVGGWHGGMMGGSVPAAIGGALGGAVSGMYGGAALGMPVDAMRRPKKRK